MKRICFVIPTLQVGGTERQLVLLVNGLRTDYEVTVVCTREAGPLSAQMRHLGARLHVLRMPTAWDPRMRRRFRDLFHEHRPDILHTFLFGFDLAANRAARDTGVPVVISSRRELAIWQKPRHVRRQQLANRFADAVVANSHAAANMARDREGGSKTLYHVIHNGIQADAFQSLADPDRVREHLAIPLDRKIITTIANFSDVKDYPLFFSTAAKIVNRDRNVHFVVVGKGPFQAEINRLIVRHQLEKRTTVLHTHDQIPDVLAATDVFTLCSKSEGFPNVIMEAMAAGRPIVARAVGGIPELIDDSVSGRLIADRDPDAMASAILELLEDRAAAQAYSTAAIHRIRRDFSVDKMVHGYRDLYARLYAAQARIVG